MKTTKRSKMLLSSIAMLLVALVALGSASFAWYNVQTSVTATGAQVSAAKADGLEIRKYTGAVLADDDTWGNWTTGITLDSKPNLAPSSIDYNQALNSVTYATGGEGASFTDGTLSGNLAAVTSGYSSFFINRFQVAASSTGGNIHWRIDNVTAPANTYVAYAIYKDGTFVGSYTSGTAASKKVKLSGTDVVANAGDDYTHTGTLTTGTNIPLTDFTVGDKNTPTDITVIGFADGFDANCKSSNANNNNVSISFTFSQNAF